MLPQTKTLAAQVPVHFWIAALSTFHLTYSSLTSDAPANQNILSNRNFFILFFFQNRNTQISSTHWKIPTFSSSFYQGKASYYTNGQYTSKIRCLQKSTNSSSLLRFIFSPNNFWIIQCTTCKTDHSHFLMFSFETLNAAIHFKCVYTAVFFNKTDLNLGFCMFDKDDLHLGSRRCALHWFPDRAFWTDPFTPFPLTPPSSQPIPCTHLYGADLIQQTKKDNLPT